MLCILRMLEVLYNDRMPQINQCVTSPSRTPNYSPCQFVFCNVQVGTMIINPLFVNNYRQQYCAKYIIGIKTLITFRFKTHIFIVIKNYPISSINQRNIVKCLPANSLLSVPAWKRCMKIWITNQTLSKVSFMPNLSINGVLYLFVSIVGLCWHPWILIFPKNELVSSRRQTDSGGEGRNAFLLLLFSTSLLPAEGGQRRLIGVQAVLPHLCTSFLKTVCPGGVSVR